MDKNTEAILSGQPSSITTTPAPAPVTAPVEPISTTPAPEPGKAEPPAPGQAEAQPEQTATPKGTAPAPGEQAAPAISDEQILGAAGVGESPEQKLGRLERDHSASSKEARRLLEQNKGFEDILKEQGIDIAKDEQGHPVGLVATKKYSKEMAGLDIKVDELPQDVQAKFETEPQKVVDFVVEKVKKAMTRVAPTLEKAAALPLSPERHDSAMTYLADMKWETGDAKFPGLAANRKLIEQMINAPTTSKALKEFYYQEPETAMALLNLQLDHARSYIAEQAKKAAEDLAKKKEGADTSPQPLPSGGGTPIVGGEPAGDLASQVAGAKLRY